MPITTAASGADADGFSVRGGVAGLNAEVVASCDDVVLGVDKDGADGEAAF